MKQTAPSRLRPHSTVVLDGPERAPSRAMLYPLGFKPEDFSKPLFGIASMWSRVTPCNMHLDRLARGAEAGANAAGGKAIVFESEEAALRTIFDGTVKKGHVVVIRYEGPKGGPGMREMLSPTSAIMGKGLGKDVALITAGRFSGGRHGFGVGHIAPEARGGGPIGPVKNGELMTIDAEQRQIRPGISAKQRKARQKAGTPRKPRYTRGVLAKYAAHVTSASLGAATDLDRKP